MKDNALYLEADEDITSAIDKLQKLAGDSAQIVVPKRSTMLQSIINLKLLKKAAEQTGKELVLVTGDRIAIELAGRVGLAVAPSLGAKAVVAEATAPTDLKTTEEIIEADDPEPSTPSQPQPAPKPASKRPLLKRRLVGDEPPAAPAPVAAPEMAPPPGPASPDEAAPAAAASPPGPKVPNFHRLQRRLLWVGLGVALIVGYTAFMYFFSSAKVTLYANGTKVDIDTSFAVDPSLKQTDTTKTVLAGQLVTVSKDLSGPFTPTGKKDVGTKASGAITVYNEFDTNPHTLVAGTRFQAPDGKIFRSRADATVPGATVGLVGGKITLNPGKSDAITVDADVAGDTYNEAPARYTIAAYSGDQQAKIYGQGAQMSGGTSKTVTVVTASDVDTAKASLLDKDKDNADRDLKGHIPTGYTALSASQATAATNVTPAPAVDAEGSTGNLTLKVTYTVLAVKQTEYQALLRKQEQSQVGTANQIYDDGLGGAQVTASDKDATGRQNFHLTTEAYGGPKLDTANVAAQLGGKRFGDAADTAKRLPGVANAEITLWPGWATNLPSRTTKITVTIQVANSKQ